MKKIIVLILTLCTITLSTNTYAQDGVQGKVKKQEEVSEEPAETMSSKSSKLLSKPDGRYKSAIGARIIGDPIGLTYKQFLGESDKALEFILGFDVFSGNGFALTGLYETHLDLFKSDVFQIYYGYGGHVGTNKGLRLGLDVVGGLDFYFKVKDVPINLSFDIKPAVGWEGENKFEFAVGGGFAVRYVLR